MSRSSGVKTFKIIAGIAGILLAFVSSAVILYCLFSDDIWYDEVFSLGFIDFGYGDIMNLTAMDVHPPFYYICLKFLTTIINKTSLTGSVIAAGKIVSWIPCILLLVIDLTYIRKRFGILTSGAFALFITAMPQLPVYFAEIRMYSLALLLVTVQILLALEIAEGKNKFGIWIAFLVTGILTAYTQYYACIAIIGVYLALLIVLIIKNREGRRFGNSIREVLVCAFVSALTYVPWLPVLYRQIKEINGKYWIQPLSLRSLGGCVKFMVLPVIDMERLPYAAAILMLAAIVLIVVISIIARKKGDLTIYVCFLAPMLTVIASGFLFSLLGTPIFIYRYMIPAAGGVWLMVAYMTDRAVDNILGGKNKKVSMVLSSVLLIPFVFTAFLSVRGFYGEEMWKKIHMDEAKEVIYGIDDNTVIITNFDHVTSVLGYYLKDNKVYLYEDDADRLISRMFPKSGKKINDEEIYKLLDDGVNVIFAGSFTSREEIAGKWRQDGIKANVTDSILIERYWIDLYRLSK